MQECSELAARVTRLTEEGARVLLLGDLNTLSPLDHAAYSAMVCPPPVVSIYKKMINDIDNIKSMRPTRLWCVSPSHEVNIYKQNNKNRTLGYGASPPPSSKLFMKTK